MSDSHVTALSSGAVIGEYRIERLLGHGGFGLTYLARDTQLNALFAIKEYLPQECAVRSGDTVTASSPSTEDNFRGGLERFKQEARALARFRHAHIARVARLLEANGTAYMVMEYEPGLTLIDFLKHRHSALNENEAATIALSILDGLEALHNVGLIHRDIKPANIYMRAQGGAMLIDFGSARQAVTSGGVGLTATFTPGYAPIEQYSSEDKQGPTADLYALGATLYRAVSGRTPVDAVRRSAALSAGDPDPLVPASSFASAELSREFLECIDWALEFHAKDRPRTAHALRERIAEVGTETVDLSELLFATGAIEGATAISSAQRGAGATGGGTTTGAHTNTQGSRTRGKSAGGRFMAAFRELRRRKVFRVGIGYVVFGLVALQLLSMVQEPLGIALVNVRKIVVAILAGFPIALLLAWGLELTPSGVRISHERRGGSLRRVELALIAAIAVATVGVGYKYYRPEAQSAGIDGTTIQLNAVSAAPAATPVGDVAVAVLPFSDLSQEGDQAWFCDGLAEEVLNLLASKKAFRVASRMQSFRYRNQQDDLHKIGAELRVTHILSGTVRRVGDKVRVNTELIEVSSGDQVWSQPFDSKMDDVLAAQAKIAADIQVQVIATLKP